MKRLLLTGASGFVGSHTLKHLLVNTDWDIICPVTYKHKGNQDRIRLILEKNPDYLKRVKIVHADLAYPITNLTSKDFGKIHYVLNLASESHVDRSIREPAAFIQNNISLMCHMLDWARTSDSLEKFAQISTDEVYGPVTNGHFHTEWVDQLLPSSPYSASKAAQEHICFAYWRTYGLPIILTNTMNIIGEMQDPEKFVPLVISKLLRNETVHLHGHPNGEIGRRFYLHARNQSDALLFLLKNQPVTLYRDDQPGIKPEKYNIVGDKEQSNLELAQSIAQILDKPLKHEISDYRLSRPGHDLRYGLNGEKLKAIGWSSPISFDESLLKTVQWYLSNKDWLNL